MSYRKKHLKSRINRSKPKTPLLKRPVFWCAFLGFIIGAAAIYFLIFFPKIQVGNITIYGNEKVSSQNLQEIISKEVDKKFTKSIFLVNLQKIKSDILKSYPVVKIVSADKKYPDSLKFEIIERKKIAVFCQDNKCFNIDDDGIIFEEFAGSLGENFIVRQNSEAHINDIILGNTVVKEQTIKSIEEIEKKLKENFQINLSEALISTPVRLNIKTGENWQIYFDISEGSDIKLQLTQLDLLLKEEISQDTRQKLEYIDLRFKDRAYYK